MVVTESFRWSHWQAEKISSHRASALALIKLKSIATFFFFPTLPSILHLLPHPSVLYLNPISQHIWTQQKTHGFQHCVTQHPRPGSTVQGTPQGPCSEPEWIFIFNDISAQMQACVIEPMLWARTQICAEILERVCANRRVTEWGWKTGWSLLTQGFFTLCSVHCSCTLGIILKNPVRFNCRCTKDT